MIDAVIPPQLPPEASTINEEMLKNSARHESGQQALAIARIYHARNSFKTVIAILNNYLICAACVTLTWWVSEASHISTTGSTALYFLSVYIIACRMRALEVLVHEASHNNLFSSAYLHKLLQFLYAFPVFRLVEDYRRSHMIHHKHLGDPQRDPDVVRLCGLGLDHFPERPIWYLLGLPMTGYLTYEYLTTTFIEFWESSSSRISKSVFWAAIMLALSLTGTFRHFAYYYLVPFLVILPITRYWAEVSEHCGLDLRGQFGSSRTNIGVFQRWFINPHNDGYHAAHHLYSQIPFYLLPDAHHRLMEASNEFAKKTVISHGMFETFKQIATKKTVFKSVT